ncbi:MAG: ABC transporter substrate-binding protein/permease [Phycisphaerae bacterium]
MRTATIAPSWMLAIALIAGALLPAVAAAQDQEPLRVALTGKYPPFSFYDSQGNLVGYDVDVSRTISQQMGRPLEIVTTEWDFILPGLLAGEYDAIIGSMAITEERAQKVLFSIPYYTSGAQLFLQRSNPHDVYSIWEAEGKSLRLGVVRGETYETYLRNHHPGIDIRTYKSSNDIFLDMETGQLDGFVTDKLVGTYQARQAGRPFVWVGDLLYEEQMAIPVVKSDPALLGEINAALQEMQRSGRLKEIYDKWFSGGAVQRDTGISSSTIAELLARGFATTLMIAALSLLIGFLLAVPGGALLNRHKGAGYFLLRSVTDFIRGTPVLIQLFFVYFGLPQIGKLLEAAFGWQVDTGLSPITAAVATLAVNSAAYMSEVVRSGLMSVDRGQKLAGRALGLSKLQVFRHIVWPQAFRIAMPPLMNSVVALIKDTALVSVLSVNEVITAAQSIISVNYDPLFYYFVVAGMFFVVTFPLMKLAGRLERKIREKGFAHD